MKPSEDSDSDDGQEKLKRALLNGEEIQIDTLKQWLSDEGKLETADVMAIIDKATKILASEPTLMTLSTPITSLLCSSQNCSFPHSPSFPFHVFFFFCASFLMFLCRFSLW